MNGGVQVNQSDEVAQIIRSKTPVVPAVGLILGSGLGEIADELEHAVHIPYQSLPYFPRSTVEGHKGRFVFGDLEGIPVVAMQGRYHYYEGYTLQQVTFPVRVMKKLGIGRLIVTNAAGGVNKAFHPGDLMLITDHLNLIGASPLIGPNDDSIGPRFPDMSAAYDPGLRQLAKEAALSLGLSIREGVYAATSGPQYETPAEVRMIRTLGADAVGMSTVPEVIAASHAGLPVVGVSCITNLACGILEKPLSHEEVIETAEKVKDGFTQLIRKIVRMIG